MKRIYQSIQSLLFKPQSIRQLIIKMEKPTLSFLKEGKFRPEVIPQKYDLPISPRATWGYIQNFQRTLSKKRISYSQNPLINVESLKSLKITANNPSPSIKKISSCTTIINSKLLNKLDLLQEKLKNAKRQIKIQYNQVGSKIKKKQCKKVRKDISQMENEEDAERQQKQLHSSYSVVVPKPCNIKSFNDNPYATRGSKYFLSAAVRCINQPTSPVMEHINQTMQMLLQYKLLKMSQDYHDKYQQLPIILPVRYEGPHRKTVILDLDETLIHCFEDKHHKADIKLNITIDGNSFQIGINIRPYAISFLKKLKKRWEIIVFTASHQDYADCILNEIDPDCTLFDHRLYRQHCKQITENLYIKSLSRLNRNLNETVLVDNAAYSYAMNLDNAIPIIPYYEGKDFELTALELYLQKLEECQNVRVINRQYFQLHQYSSFDSNVEIVNQLYCKQIN